jgi:hypothetical protein
LFKRLAVSIFPRDANWKSKLQPHLFPHSHGTEIDPIDLRYARHSGNEYRGRRFTLKLVPNYSGNDYQGGGFTPKLVTNSSPKLVKKSRFGDDF